MDPIIPGRMLIGSSLTDDPIEKGDGSQNGNTDKENKGMTDFSCSGVIFLPDIRSGGNILKILSILSENEV